ncbi:cytochrome aa3 quinol oxidase subunit IV [Alteribacillus iranensis]|uniref:Quinol oxidase subunit 4 n=1 Tax=Alteribacillus iranensis TaxID=930128 RepID=A0A1I2EAP2_9BACI|nr:cytochrome aa3 quinol oxidase subunit IV [Alteribacillus iranensis]SFE90064.1 cytochrome aa3 quinol oxidase subunit 4 [Alteribacillus iranensis]
MSKNTKHVPVQHIIGFLLSIVLTLLAVWAALGSNLPVAWIIIAIMALAIIQAGIQLFMFMHMTESSSGGGHVPWNMMFHGFVLAAIIVAGSLFTMSFGFHHDHGSHTDHQEESSHQHD